MNIYRLIFVFIWHFDDAGWECKSCINLSFCILNLIGGKKWRRSWYVLNDIYTLCFHHLADLRNWWAVSLVAKSVLSFRTEAKKCDIIVKVASPALRVYKLGYTANFHVACLYQFDFTIFGKGYYRGTKMAQQNKNITTTVYLMKR